MEWHKMAGRDAKQEDYRFYKDASEFSAMSKLLVMIGTITVYDEQIILLFWHNGGLVRERRR